MLFLRAEEHLDSSLRSVEELSEKLAEQEANSKAIKKQVHVRTVTATE